MFGGLDLELIAVLIAVATIAGCVDAIAGGGGLLTVPALLLAGVDPVSALATNKLQGSASSISATIAFARKGLVHWPTGWPLALASGTAAVLGAMSVTLLPDRLLAATIPLLLVVIAVYFATARRMGNEDAKARIPAWAFVLLFIPAIGFYDGIFGPGAGSFYMAGFVTLLGYGVIRATAHTKLANAASNVGSLAFFAATGAIIWPVGLAMAAGAFVGAQIGSGLAMRFGARLIRPLIVVIACGMAVRLLAEADNPLRVWVLELLGI